MVLFARETAWVNKRKQTLIVLPLLGKSLRQLRNQRTDQQDHQSSITFQQSPRHRQRPGSAPWLIECGIAPTIDFVKVGGVMQEKIRQAAGRQRSQRHDDNKQWMAVLAHHQQMSDMAADAAREELRSSARYRLTTPSISPLTA